jgi:hypothetical protein
MKESQQGSWRPDGDLNQAHPEYISKVLPLQQPCPPKK